MTSPDYNEESKTEGFLEIGEGTMGLVKAACTVFWAKRGIRQYSYRESMGHKASRSRRREGKR